MGNHKRIIKNTIMLYFRQILILFVSLYTVRVVLNIIGIEDYGVYSVVGGIVLLFSFLSNSMSSATQRFFSFSIGQNDTLKLKQVFVSNIIIYLSIAIITVIILETGGLFYVKNVLKVHPDRVESAVIVFHFSVLTLISTILTAPFKAIIIAHEDMYIYAYVSIAESLLKLLIVYLLNLISMDKLELYGILVFIVSLVNAFIFAIICFKKYQECIFSLKYYNKQVLFDIFSYTGWTLFGQLTTVIRNQAITILLNQVFNPITVAARAIANSITSKINMFSNNFNIGLYPPIIKTYASGKKDEMFSLIYYGSKIAFYLMWIFALPILIEIKLILDFWLVEYPPEALIFTRLGLVESLIFSFNLPLTTAARAPGKIKLYEIVLGAIQISIFIFSYIALKFGYSAYSVYVIAISANLLMFIFRLLLVKILISLKMILFIKKVIYPISIVVFISSVLSLLTHEVILSLYKMKILLLIVYPCYAVLAIYFFGLDKNTRIKLLQYIKTKLSFIIKKN